MTVQKKFVKILILSLGVDLDFSSIRSPIAEGDIETECEYHNIVTTSKYYFFDNQQSTLFGY